MFTDMVGFSTLSQRSEPMALALLAESQRLLRSQFPLFNGREVKSTGDGFLVEFPSALEATQCAVEIQRALAARNATHPPERHFQVRIGIHLGDVVYREADMYGDGVNIAARIEPLAHGGGICLSDAVVAQVRNKLDVELAKLRSPELKHIDARVEVYRVVLPWQKGSRSLDRPSALPPSRALARAVAWLVVGVSIVGGVSWWVFHLPSPATKTLGNLRPSVSTSRPGSASPMAPVQKSIAVLPFVNMSADKADEYLSDGMTEELLNVLAKVPGLHVPGRSSSFAFKGKSEEGIFQKVGEQLHVTTVLEGSVRKAGEKLRITAQLINVADGFHLWSETYDRQLSDILAVQSEVAQEVVAALKIQLGMADAQRLQAKPTSSLKAYELYLKGRFNLYQYTDQSCRQAIDQFNEAINLDPAFARAYAGLAATYAYISSMFMPPKEAMPLAKRYVVRALELDEALPEAHHSYATIKWWGDWEFPAAEREFRRSLELNPNEARVYCDYSEFLTMLGRYEEALDSSKRATQLALADGLLSQASVCYCSRRYDQALALARQAVDANANSFWGRPELAEIFLQLNQFDDAIRENRLALELASPGDHPLQLLRLAITLAVAGHQSEAREHLDKVNQFAKQNYISPVWIGLLHDSLGERELAVQYLQTAYEGRCDHLLDIKKNPLFDSLRLDPRVSELLRKLGLGN